MKINKIYYGIVVLFTLAIAACQDDPNDWEIDKSYERLFRSTNFESVEKFPTAIKLTFDGVKGATNYVFEFSKGDSLLFDNIVSTVDILADTLTAYNESAAIVRTEYRVFFEGLDGTTRYSVRMKAVDKNTGMESGYVQFCFDTPDEQIFTGATPGTSALTLNWIPGEAATHINFAELVRRAIPPAAEGEPSVTVTDTLWRDAPFILTEAQKQAGELSISGLKPGTNYLAHIFNEEARRGVYVVRTLGSSAGTMITVNQGDDINALIADLTGDITLVLEGGQTYEMVEFTVPAGINNLYISGNVNSGRMPILLMSKFVFQGLLTNFYVQSIDLVSTGASQFLIEVGNAQTGFASVSFEGCRISEIPRSLVRTSSTAPVQVINITNCFIKNVGLSGYGLLNIGQSSPMVSINMTRNTMVNIGDQIIDLRANLDRFTYTQSTFCNYTIAIPKLFRFDRQPQIVTVTGNIFGGTNNGNKVDAGSSNYGYLSFAGCYLTADFVENNRPFTDVQKLTMTSEELFVDPSNDDFHFKPELKFEGEGKVGDPRWWTR